MRSLLLLLFAGCASVVSPEDNKCQNQEQIKWSVVADPLNVFDDTKTTTMANGCTLTVITHYVYDNTDDGSGNGFNFTKCQAADCDTLFLNTFSDPAPMK